jgi:hypothetical protein
MVTERTKYEKVIGLLKRSVNEQVQTQDIADNVISALRKSQKNIPRDYSILNYLFGWVYIGWIRKSLVTISFVLIGIFLYQQSLILKRVNKLEYQTSLEGKQYTGFSTSGSLEELLTIRSVKSRFLMRRAQISGKQLDEILDSYNDLDHKYKDLVKIIENDPELKRTIEEKLSEKNKKKFNL